MPEWLADILRQFPTLAVCLAVAWFAFQRLTAQHDAHLKGLQDANASTLTALKAVYDAHLASKDDEIKRLTALLAKEQKRTPS